jgi:hypothetical protein
LIDCDNYSDIAVTDNEFIAHKNALENGLLSSVITTKDIPTLIDRMYKPFESVSIGEGSDVMSLSAQDIKEHNKLIICKIINEKYIIPSKELSTLDVPYHMNPRSNGETFADLLAKIPRFKEYNLSTNLLTDYPTISQLNKLLSELHENTDIYYVLNDSKSDLATDLALEFVEANGIKLFKPSSLHNSYKLNKSTIGNTLSQYGFGDRVREDDVLAYLIA